MEPAGSAPSSTPAPPVAAVMGLLAAQFFGFLLVGSLLQYANLPLGLIWTEAFIFFAPAYLLARAWNGQALDWLGLGRTRLLPVALGALVGVANYPVAGGLESLVRALLPESWLAHLPGLGAALGTVHGWQRVAMIFAVAVAAPLGEETLFRGLIQRTLNARLGAARAITTTALIFGLIHLEPVGLLARIELAVVFGLLVHGSGTLWASVAAHGASNLLAAIIYFSAGHEEAAQGAPHDALAVIGLGLLVTLPLLFVVSRLRTARVEPEWLPPGDMSRTLLRWLAAAALGAAAVGTAAISGR